MEEQTPRAYLSPPPYQSPLAQRRPCGVPLPSTGQGLSLPGRQDGGGRGPAGLCPHTDLLGAGWLQPGARWPPLCARTQPQGWLQYYLQIKTTEGITECDPEDTPRASPREPRLRHVGDEWSLPPSWSLRPQCWLHWRPGEDSSLQRGRGHRDGVLHPVASMGAGHQSCQEVPLGAGAAHSGKGGGQPR